jgi:hypothetical protein
VPHETYSVFAPWSNFYIIAGSAAATLTGLMFVVVTLATAGPSRQRDEMYIGFAVFNTPTVMHFCTAFLISGILSAPWRSALFPDVIIGIIGFSGLLYVLRVVIFRTNRLRTYEPDIEDWAWFGILPMLAYAAVTAASILFPWHAEAALFTLAAAIMLLIFIGIRNAWDIVIYLALEQAQKR